MISMPARWSEGRAGIGRYVLGAEIFEHLAKAHTEGELSDWPGLEGLAEGGQLLGSVTEQSILHLGS